MNITISHDGHAVVLRIEPGNIASPLTISDTVLSASLVPTEVTKPAIRPSFLRSQPVRRLAVGAIMAVSIVAGMVISDPARTSVQPHDADAPVSTVTSGGKVTRNVGSLISASDATREPQTGGAVYTTQPREIVAAPTIKPGSAQAQRQFGLNP